MWWFRAILVLAFGLGIVLLLLTAVWWIVRCDQGADGRQPAPDHPGPADLELVSNRACKSQ